MKISNSFLKILKNELMRQFPYQFDIFNISNVIMHDNVLLVVVDDTTEDIENDTGYNNTTVLVYDCYGGSIKYINWIRGGTNLRGFRTNGYESIVIEYGPVEILIEKIFMEDSFKIEIIKGERDHIFFD